VSRGPAVVTGASSGLGRAYAESLAARGHPLIAIARRGDRLRELEAWARERHGVATDVVEADLATEEGLAACRDAVSRAPVAPEVVVLNAGFGSRGSSWRLDRAREADMVRVNCVAVVDLAVHALPAMVAAGRGALVVVSSAAAWQPVPHMATYAATKAFELHWTEAVAEELRGTGVRALVVCPGPTRTEFTLSGGGGSTYPGIPFDDVEMVVRATWRALAAGRRRAPTGVIARGSMLASRLLPRGVVLRAAALTHRERG
jgi:short-subunit dehydrogenase